MHPAARRPTIWKPSADFAHAFQSNNARIPSSGAHSQKPMSMHSGDRSLPGFAVGHLRESMSRHIPSARYAEHADSARPSITLRGKSAFDRSSRGIEMLVQNWRSSLRVSSSSTRASPECADKALPNRQRMSLEKTLGKPSACDLQKAVPLPVEFPSVAARRAYSFNLSFKKIGDAL